MHVLANHPIVARLATGRARKRRKKIILRPSIKPGRLSGPIPAPPRREANTSIHAAPSPPPRRSRASSRPSRNPRRASPDRSSGSLDRRAAGGRPKGPRRRIRHAHQGASDPYRRRQDEPPVLLLENGGPVLSRDLLLLRRPHGVPVEVEREAAATSTSWFPEPRESAPIK